MDNSLFLRRIFKLDALTCFACFALLTVGATPLAPLFGLDALFLRTAGLLLLPCAALFLWLGTRVAPPLALSVVAILGNFLWVAESVAVMTTRQDTLTAIGTAFVGTQAAAVLVLALLESHGVKIMRRATAMAR
ncbi:hypothetical protein [Sphingomonas cavernae]|uniref:Uncharacterized protein n=1 Tax=Sphingomonas cavernae TaxID=2320861 RepID=A0A418W6P4_9SPHN|nr:hypothetical protein [Sphingomonas cavernae]RJF85607.1 hypothetical protein D3876_16965 [Sphingomonas cavernae]